MSKPDAAVCPICEEPQHNISSVRTHLKDIHDITIDVEELEFQSEEGKLCIKIMFVLTI